MWWPFRVRTSEGDPAPLAPDLVEHDVLANFSAAAVDVRWKRDGMDVFGIRMSAPGAREFAAKVVSAADAIAGAIEVDLAAEDLEQAE